jgi:lipopolysaccharide export system permease protein
VRILDKYLLRELAWPVVYCLDAFLLLGITIDLFENLPDFLQHHARIGQVIQFYLIVFPEMFSLMLPMSLLLGLLFCLSNLGKHNELAAMRSSGVSIARLAAPFLAAGALAAVLLFAVNELFVPESKDRADAVMAGLEGKRGKDVIENFFFTNPAEHREWYARQFDTRALEMRGLVQVTERKPGMPERRIDAAAARWEGGVWQFYQVRINSSALVAMTNFPGISEPPKRLAVEGKKPNRVTSAELRRYIRAQERYGNTRYLAPYRVELHYRYAYPLTCLMVVWIGLPLGMHRSRSGPLRAVGTALVLIVGYYFVTHFAMGMGRIGQLSPLAAAWTSNIIFTAVGAGLFYRVR